MTVEQLASRAALRVHPHDDLAVALRDLPTGRPVEVADRTIDLAGPVRAKHSFALRDLNPGQKVRMHGVIVGEATEAVRQGEPLTTANLKHASADFHAGNARYRWQPPDVSRWQAATFDGFWRGDGSVGTANYWIFVPLVFCENENLDKIRDALLETLGYQTTGRFRDLARQLTERYRGGASTEDLLQLDLSNDREPASSRLFPNVDGIRFLTHNLGCGGTREDARSLCGLLAGYINHPNVAGATVLSLGCQNAQLEILQEELRLRNPGLDKPVLIFEQHRCTSQRQMLADAIKQTFVGLSRANHLTRRPAPLSKLTIGVECGASDGFSGISANPTVGHLADLVVALGGRVILSEFPELCGVEQELINRCVDQPTAERFVQLMREYAARAEAVRTAFSQNPSPGNIRDGLITDAMKSAGAARKGGSSPVVDVVDYPGTARKAGLNLLCTPGGDVESTTALAGAGANLILFTTGLGTPTGNAVTPLIKVSSNSEVAKRLPDLIDFDAGPIIRGERTIEQLGEELLEMCIEAASGRFTPAAVRNGNDEFLPWKRGVSL